MSSRSSRERIHTFQDTLDNDRGLPVPRADDQKIACEHAFEQVPPTIPRPLVRADAELTLMEALRRSVTANADKQRIVNRPNVWKWLCKDIASGRVVSIDDALAVSRKGVSAPTSVRGHRGRGARAHAGLICLY
jgi:hypothetical protein